MWLRHAVKKGFLLYRSQLFDHNERFDDRVREAREEFIFFYNRGLSEPDRWFRPNSIYFMWSLCPDKDNGQSDFVIVDIWDRVLTNHHLKTDGASFEELMFIFDMMESYAKLWIFFLTQ